MLIGLNINLLDLKFMQNKKLINELRNKYGNYIGEYNSPSTRHNISRVFKRILNKQNPKLYKFRVTCNKSNNPDFVIDKHDLNVDVYIQPTLNVRYIKVNFSVK